MRTLLMMTGLTAAFGGVGEKKTVNYQRAREGEHKGLFEALEHVDVQTKLQTLAGAKLQPVEYATQVVQGLKYIVTMKDDRDQKYEVHIWQKPFNSVKNELPPPEVVKIITPTEDL